MEDINKKEEGEIVPPKEEPKAAPADAKAPAPAEGGKKASPIPTAKRPRALNCEACNKSIKDKWYYRNGRFYCTKQCFKSFEKKEKAKAQSASK